MPSAKHQSRSRLCRALLGAALVLATGNGFAHGTVSHDESQTRPVAASAPAPTADVTLHDAALVNQDGETMKFASEVMGDKLVALTFFYTSCKTICPVTSIIFNQIQDRLGDRLGDEVRLVSVTVDPITDTPARLEAYAAKFKPKPGWIWLTGDKQSVDQVLEGLGAYAADYTQHPLVVLVGDPASGRWSRLFGFPSPDDIVARLDALKATRIQARLAAP